MAVVEDIYQSVIDGNMNAAIRPCGHPDKELLDKLVQQTARYFREREEVLL